MNPHEQAQSRTDQFREFELSVELVDERRRLILDLLESDGRVLAPQLAARFATSEDTIRRDLREMDREGLLRRVHGGAIKAKIAELPFRDRANVAPGRKGLLAATAVRLVTSDDVVLIDAGSTNLQIAKALPDGLASAIITSSPEIAAAIGNLQRTEVIVLGGTIRPGSGSVGGAVALRQIENLRPDLCFLGACSIDVDAGLCASNGEEAALKRAMGEASARVAAAILNERLAARAAFKVLPLAAIGHLVLESDAPKDVLALLRAINDGPEVVCA